MTRSLLSLLVLGALATAAHATVLTFDITGATSGTLLPQGYGDNVTAQTMGAFSYGTAGGFTPDVTVNYNGTGGGQADLNFWQAGYSDLTNVVEYEPDGAPGYSIVFIADGGQNVTLDSFDLGNFGGDVVLPGFTIRDAWGAPIYSQANINVPGSGGSHLSFAPNITSSVLILSLDLTGLGGNSDNMGLDNIQFHQSAAAVPEPATLAALGLGFAAIARRRRK